MPTEEIAIARPPANSSLHPDSLPDFAPARAVLNEAIRQHALPGAAWGVLHQGNILALEAAGRFTYDPASPAVDPATIYDLASVTKVVATTAAAMLLHDRGLFDLDTRLGDILPAFVIGGQPGSGKIRVTLRTLLAHSSGLPGYVKFFETCATPDALLRAALQLPLEAKPGARTEYSDPGYILLGKAIEVVAGESLDAFCAREIFAPLGLASTQFCPPAAARNAIPPTENDTGFRRRIIQGEVQDENASVLGGVAGHAGVFSSVPDLLRFAQCILDRGRTAAGAQLFRPETIDLFATPHATPDGNTRALGWDVPTPPSASGRHFGPRSIGHLGYAGTSLWIDPDPSLAIVLLTNRTWPDRASDAIRQVRPAFHDAVVDALHPAS
ncbi:MAG TPA: serine hydrolase domain-containing protein [Acidobacteriaceae bacterium]|jgi:CubicO group peptidase (beta-lactamase class C family)|nr:serine hydrolase domain-containing protein [Acidobacteriaceae bacterium]